MLLSSYTINVAQDDPIDTAVYKAYTRMVKKENADAAAELIKAKYQQEKYVGFNPIVKRTVAFVTDKKTAYVMNWSANGGDGRHSGTP